MKPLGFGDGCRCLRYLNEGTCHLVGRPEENGLLRKMNEDGKIDHLLYI